MKDRVSQPPSFLQAAAVTIERSSLQFGVVISQDDVAKNKVAGGLSIARRPACKHLDHVPKNAVQRPFQRRVARSEGLGANAVAAGTTSVISAPPSGPLSKMMSAASF